MSSFVAEAFILSRIKYSESSFIVKAYTKEMGLISFMAKGYNSKNKKGQNLFQPFSKLEVALFQRQPNSLYQLKSASVLKSNVISLNVQKQPLLFLISELVLRYVREEEQNQGLYSLIEKTAEQLESSTINETNNISMLFLYQLTDILGILPSINNNKDLIFCLKEGCSIEPSKAILPVSKEDNQLLLEYISSNISETKFSKDQRRTILKLLIQYVDIQLSRTGPIKSLEVFEQW